LKKDSDILDQLATMDPAEGVKLLEQLFNPMRDKHVGFREDTRK